MANRRVIRLTLLGVVGVALVILGLARGGAPAPVSGAFGQHWRGLEARRLAAGVTTMRRPTSDAHTHLRLRVWVDGRRVGVPAGIGIDPARSSGDMASLHTHSDDGKIHNEGQADATLAQLLAVWGIPFGPSRLGAYSATTTKRVQLWVDGRSSAAWGSLRLQDGQEIDLAYGKPRPRPPED